MGYAIELAAGTLPDGVSIPSPIRTLDNAIWFHWIDGATDEQESLDFTLLIRPMDEAGNIGDGVTVAVRHEGDSGGCAIAARPISESWPPSFVLTLLGLALARAVARRSR
jgi:hypothetical protein